MIRETGWHIDLVNALEMPDVFEFLHDLFERPTSYQLLRAQIGYVPRQIESETISDEEQVSTNVKTFDSLPLLVQESIIKQHGCSSYREYAELCKRNKNKVN